MPFSQFLESDDQLTGWIERAEKFVGTLGTALHLGKLSTGASARS